jgi:hypothetical protein
MLATLFKNISPHVMMILNFEGHDLTFRLILHFQNDSDLTSIKNIDVYICNIIMIWKFDMLLWNQ